MKREYLFSRFYGLVEPLTLAPKERNEREFSPFVQGAYEPVLTGSAQVKGTLQAPLYIISAESS